MWVHPQQPSLTPPPLELLSSADLAAILKVSPRQIGNMAQRGQLPKPVRIPGLGLRWLKHDLEVWLAARVGGEVVTEVMPGSGETSKPARPRRQRSCDEVGGLTRGGETP